jgi:hypothetical protein
VLSPNPPPKVISFDCYGTLVRWREVLLAEITRILSARGRNPGEASAVLDSFSRLSLGLTQEKPHRLYKSILRIGFRSALVEHRLQPVEDEVSPRDVDYGHGPSPGGAGRASPASGR